jgi:hypothetical protein
MIWALLVIYMIRLSDRKKRVSSACKAKAPRTDAIIPNITGKGTFVFDIIVII